jgi:hypothetical protein
LEVLARVPIERAGRVRNASPCETGNGALVDGVRIGF